MLASLSLKRLPPAPTDPSNSVERQPAAVELGRRLFEDARLSRKCAVSRATCHDPAKQFQDGQAPASGSELDHASIRAKRMGHRALPQSDGGTTTVFYPANAAESLMQMGPFRFSWAEDAPPSRGNGRLVVLSHGSGGSPWVHVDLARALVERGFTVALPQHAGDNFQDPSQPGPTSWARRPVEVSQAIDRVAADNRLAPLLRLDAVGVFGGSAGGHTALSLAGGQWSPSRFRDHCLQQSNRTSLPA